MKTTDAKADTSINYKINYNTKNPKVKVPVNIKISKCQNTFSKGYTRNSPEKFFVIKELIIQHH